jgi:hypothetical protein
MFGGFSLLSQNEEEECNIKEVSQTVAQGYDATKIFPTVHQEKIRRKNSAYSV